MINDEKIKVEFVCEGNSSRSELARLFTNKLLNKHNLETQYTITSSGIYVNTKGVERLTKFTDIEINSFLKAAINYNFFKQTRIIDEVYNSIQENNKNKKLAFLIQSAQFISEMELKYREIYRKKLGISECFKNNCTQTTSNNYIDGVFSMNENINKKVKEIYLTRGYTSDDGSTFSKQVKKTSKKIKHTFCTTLNFNSINPIYELTNEIIEGSFEKTYDNAIALLEKQIPIILEEMKKKVNINYYI